MLKIAVLVKYCGGDLNPFDASALECAQRLENAEITVVTMSPLSVKEKLLYISRLGINRVILISDLLYAGSDTLATSRVLSTALKILKPDLVLCGRQSVDGDTAQVPAEISSMLGYNLITNAMEFNLKEINTRLGRYKIKLPCVVSVEKFLQLRSASIFSKPVGIEIWDNSTLKIEKDKCGLKGSPTRVIKTFENGKVLRKCVYINSKELSSAIQEALNKPEINNVIESSPEKLEKVYIVGDGLDDTAKNISKEVIRLPETDKFTLKMLIEGNCAEYVLFKADLKNRALAPSVAALLNCGLCADCTHLETDGKKLFMFRPAGGGNIMAKIECRSKITMATVREKNFYGKDIVFGIGLGAKDYIDKIKTFAHKFGAEIVASRKAVDENLMPYEAQVGLTGRIIAPKVYVAFGVSGEIHHIAGVEKTQTIIAVNKDKNAKIFNYADFGVTEDIRNVKL